MFREEMETDDAEVEPNRSSTPSKPVVYDEQRRKDLLDRLHREKQVLSTLPPASKYVRHRLKVVEKAVQILSSQEHCSQDDATAQLTRLLESLAI
ncbi:hypothetical protein BWQ96_02695 [Gracilariopsis chorda]|uniref:Uncharacterized protein n=1 Tax=Gracilariopsis chorda TaxID=448386 RepID=A0A2V3IZI4_9FLOR|nr:hypothetical protein BWQ96_02695 [Gracilariopsis chorda]|eukprot:PXF47551.1 hypothetical protein BWQ96_02695 [Gracilariopsis chorda]